MARTSFLVVALILCGLLTGAAPPSPAASSAVTPSAYLDPALLAPGAATRAVIVSGSRDGAAAAAVARVGGQITSNLWLIDAVAATVPAARMHELAGLPGIASVVAEQAVRSSDAKRPGWVSERRERKGLYELAGIPQVPASLLSDGRAALITDNGHLLVINPDGTVATQVNLRVGGFKTAPLIGADDTIYVARKDKQVYAIWPSGAIRWTYTGGEEFQGGLARGVDGTLYAVDEKRNLVALNPATGTPLWRLSLGTDRAGATVSAPVVGPDGTIIVATNSNPGWLFAVTPAGRLRWSFVGLKDAPLTYAPLISPRGTIIVASAERLVYGLDIMTGALSFTTALPEEVIAQPVMGGDGSLYLSAEERRLIALEPTGKLRFEFQPAGGRFRTAPTLAPDGSTVYVAAEEGTLFAVGAATGSQQWSYNTLGALKVSPTVGVDGAIYLGSDAKELVVLTPAGQSSSRLMLEDHITQPISLSARGDLLVRLGDKRLFMAGYLPELWDGSRDVEPTEVKREWKLSNPVTIDVGADVLHEQAITGAGVTVAVVDSGVYFNKKIEEILGLSLDRQFLGQADFLGNGTCQSGGEQLPKAPLDSATPRYCFTDHKNSVDSYGHGSHVAGIIWSQITDYATGVNMGMAPGANILSVRVLDEHGRGTYTDVIEGIQFVVQNQAQLRVRILNLSLSAQPSVPYFVDPLNRAVERAWANGIVVMVAAGNGGPGAETITVPGNDPYVITVGAINSNRTPGYWADDFVPTWSASGPTADGFVKPDILAPGSNIISFIYTNKDDSRSAQLARIHPDHAIQGSTSLFRMNGTSMATAVASGVAALMLQSNPSLTPDEVKGRLVSTARPALMENGEAVYSPLQQGAGRVWAPDAVLGTIGPDERANVGMDINQDLGAGYESEEQLVFHYQGPVRRAISDDGRAYLYYVEGGDGTITGLGVSRADGQSWIDQQTLASGRMTWSVGRMTWSVGMPWAGGASQAAGRMTWSVGRMTWSVSNNWSVGRMTWSVGRMTWSVGNTWSSGSETYATARDLWANSTDLQEQIISSTLWAEDE